MHLRRTRAFCHHHISTSAPSSMTRSGGMRKNSVGRVAMRARVEIEALAPPCHPGTRARFDVGATDKEGDTVLIPGEIERLSDIGWLD